MRKLTAQVSAAAATAETFDFTIPRDSLIHAIIITIGEDTTSTATTRGTLADDLVSLDFIINGYLHVKTMRAGMNKALAIMNDHVAQPTGFYKINFKDSRIPEAQPLPAFIDDITSLTLRLVDNTPAGSNYHHINVTLLEQKCPPALKADAAKLPVLCETYPMRQSWTTNTGWVTPYEHERVQKVYGYLYEFLDDGTLEDPAVDGYDLFKVIGRVKGGGTHRIVEESYLLDQKEINKSQYQVALPTGYVALEFPIPLDTKQYSNLYSYIHIHTAATAAQMRVLERYLLG